MSDVLHYRALIGAFSRSRPDDDAELVEAKQGLAEAKIAAYVEKVLSQAPPLSSEQRTRLVELLRPARRSDLADRRAVASMSPPGATAVSRMGGSTAPGTTNELGGGASPPTSTPPAVNGVSTSPQPDRKGIVAERIAELDGGAA
jgi:hypothetical protein